VDEERARALFETIAAAPVPPAKVDVERARRLGRRKLRWRRTGLASGPAVAAVAVIAVVGGLTPLGGQPGGHRPATAEQVSPPRRFSPLIPYVAFGWLPPGDAVDGGQLAPTVAYLTAGKGGKWGLTVFVTGRCDLTSAQVLRLLHRHGKPQLTCTTTRSAAWSGQITGIAHPVAGHAAFWTLRRGELVWEYARHSWALLAGPAGRVADREAVTIASHVKFAAATVPSIEFPAQLTGLPSAWRVSDTDFAPDAGLLRASEYTLVGGGQRPTGLTTVPATSRDSCYFYPGHSEHRTINGHPVTVSHLPAARGNPAVQQVCAAHADGLMIFVSTYGRPTLSAIAIFAHHLHLLGTNPANWTTRPLS
jgi:hypothetical protein